MFSLQSGKELGYLLMSVSHSVLPAFFPFADKSDVVNFIVVVVMFGQLFVFHLNRG